MQKYFMRVMFWVVIANFVAQIPYYIHQYYLTTHMAPGLIGLILMLGVFAWFLVGYWKLIKGKLSGYYTLLSFFIIEFLFYSQTQLIQAIGGNSILLHVVHYDGLVLFVVFALGYINWIAAAYFIYYLLRNKSYLLEAQQ